MNTQAAKKTNAAAKNRASKEVEFEINFIILELLRETSLLMQISRACDAPAGKLSSNFRKAIRHGANRPEIIFMIQIKNLTKIVRSGADDLTILDNVSLEIPDGQFASVTGASGSGKSTLLGLIAGLDAPTSGEILIDGEDITKMSEDALADLRSGKLGFIFQSFHLIPSLTALENIMIPLEIANQKDAKERARNLLEEVGLTNRGHHYPTELSGGEQQRIAIARAFANTPKILLADEPTGNLDSKNGAHIFDLMTKLHAQNNLSLILVTHDQNLAEKAERQIRLRDGRVID